MTSHNRNAWSKTESSTAQWARLLGREYLALLLMMLSIHRLSLNSQQEFFWFCALKCASTSAPLDLKMLSPLDVLNIFVCIFMHGCKKKRKSLLIYFQALSFLYPYGATLNVARPATAVLSTGSVSFPQVFAFWWSACLDQTWLTSLTISLKTMAIRIVVWWILIDDKLQRFHFSGSSSDGPVPAPRSTWRKACCCGERCHA